ncbi:hypothetical protein CCAND93_1550005 [Capnocytophaga canis]|uniref:Uncharacterized protein n=1 Tax=Capnocytophaga canis TaxID=1848903 RepID=A0A0B7IHI8_9FLAO|nr:hypothetical protein CCAND93_1550005 [Capnocytophaga canis]
MSNEMYSEKTLLPDAIATFILFVIMLDVIFLD